MAASAFIRKIRAKVGDDLLFLPSAGCLIRDAAGHILLIQDAEVHRWILPGGAIDPGEEPAQAARREAYEETGLVVEIENLAGVFGGPEFFVRYPNGDKVLYIAIVFFAKVTGGELNPLDGEAMDLRYFAPEKISALPMGTGSRRIVETLVCVKPDRLPFYSDQASGPLPFEKPRRAGSGREKNFFLGAVDVCKELILKSSSV